MIAPLLALLAFAVQDSVPTIALPEALRRAATIDPGYVASMGTLRGAEAAQQSARLSLLLPTVSAGGDASRYSTESFNIGTGRPQNVSVSARLDARYELFTGGRKRAEYVRSQIEVERAELSRKQTELEVAYRTETAYFQVLQSQDFVRVATDRVRRTEEQLVVARARVLTGAAVSSDSLQLRLEVNRARLALIRQESALRVARLELGRSVGEPGPLGAEPVGGAPPPLPLTIQQAIEDAVANSPVLAVAHVNEDASRVAIRGLKGVYFPQLTLSASSLAFDTKFFPSATTRSQVSLSASWPLWSNWQAETALARAQATLDAASATVSDRERAVQRDVTDRYESYTTSLAALELANEAIVVAQENFRVQDERYRAGASTILELLDAQSRLADAESELIQARYGSHLALTALEVAIGRRLFDNRN